MNQGDASSLEQKFREVMFALSLMRDSQTEWSKTPSSAHFEAPEFVPQLHERCERILELLREGEIPHVSADARLPWHMAATRILGDVDKAADARRQFLHPLATENRRKQNMVVINFHLEEAYKAAKRLATELERYRILMRGGPPKEKPNAATIRALQRVLSTLQHPEFWCKGFEARDRDGRRTRWSDSQAYSFSIVGAIYAATQFSPPDQQRDAFAFVGYAAKCRNAKELEEWNDKLGTTHRDLIKAIGAAIKYLERNDRSWQHKLDL
ncbi:hypothetical protein F0U59_09680 [Archangium gephyra]|nr:hypothetical protein F0U59_09680 [Archangium gephyra]